MAKDRSARRSAVNHEPLALISALALTACGGAETQSDFSLESTDGPGTVAAALTEDGLSSEARGVSCGTRAPAAAGAQQLLANGGPVMTPAALADFRLYLDFSASTYKDHDTEKNEVFRGIELGLRMWQSVLPGLRYRWVSSPAEANLKLIFADYRLPASRQPTECPPSTSDPLAYWTGCGTPHAAGVLPPGAAIWFNDRGKAVGGANIPPFSFDRFSFISRNELLRGYMPATVPPVGYTRNPANPGHHNGLFSLSELYGSDDVSMILFHEFGHVLGMGHYDLSDWDLIEWYGNPLTEDGLVTHQPAARVTEADYPGLPAHLYNDSGYFGGGRYNEATEEIESRLTSDLDEMHPIMFNHHHGRDGETPESRAHVAGIPLPPYAGFNNRVVYPDDLHSKQLPPYTWSYPRISGAIVLYQTLTGRYFITSDWSVATAKAQLDREGQPDYWFIHDVIADREFNQKISAGSGHTLAIRNDGSVWSWGRNHFGQLGNGAISTSPTTTTTRPARVTGLTGTFVSVAAGLEHSVALRSDGTIWAWGRNTSGEVGNNTTSTPKTTAVQVCNISGQPCFGNKYVAIAAGGAHTLALRDDATLWAWGYNGEGQVGQGHTAPVLLPREQSIQELSWNTMAAGSNHSLGLISGGWAAAWGYNHRGQLGNSSTESSSTPSLVQTPNRWKALARGSASHSSLAQDLDGTLWAWGDNSAGQLGRSVSELTFSDMPIEVQGEGRTWTWTQLAQGTQHAGGLKDGRIWTWGANGSGQLGRGAIGSTATPGEVSGSRTDWTALAMGASHSLGFRSNGVLWAWGSNVSGQFGNGSTSPSNTPALTNFGDRPTATLTGSWVDGSGVTYTTLAPGTLNVLRTRNAQSVITSGPINLSSTTYGNIERVDFRNGSTTFAPVSTADAGGSYQASFTPSAVGQYALTARPTDRMSTQATSPQLTVAVYQLTDQVAPPPRTSVSLNDEGVLDWVHWGKAGTGAIERPCTDLIQLSSFTEVTRCPSPLCTTSSSTPGFTWSYTAGGCSSSNPDPNATRTGVKFGPFGFGVISIPATATARTLQVWLRVRNSRATINPQLGPVSKSSVTFPSTVTSQIRHYLYTATFASPVSGLPLNLRVNHASPTPEGDHEVVLQAVALK
jgi:alpha-tubulin suppressor-like RCC1 family protein